MICIVGLGLSAASLRTAGVALATYVAFGIATSLRHRSRQGLGVKQALRLLLWTAPGPLALAAVLRLANLTSAVPLLLALLLAYLLLERGLRAGLGDRPDQDERPAGAT